MQCNIRAIISVPKPVRPFCSDILCENYPLYAATSRFIAHQAFIVYIKRAQMSIVFGIFIKFLQILLHRISEKFLPYYCAIGGWVLKYFISFATGDGVAAAADNYFTDHITSLWLPIILMAVFVGGSVCFLYYAYKSDKGEK